MTAASPDVTVVIPTRNRADSLRRTLAALSRQAFPADRFEVIVVDDGGTDDAAGLAAGFAAPFRLITASTGRPAGAAAARNRGAERASGRLLLFLDDDIEACPDLVAAHLRAHEAGGADVSTGYLPPAVADASGFFGIALRGWWEAMFAAMRQRGHRYSFRDLLTGNCAIEATLFRRAGGFDERLACHEDYELGARLIAMGAKFQFVEEAWGFHHERTTLVRALERKRSEGRADVQILDTHPRLWSVLPIGFFERHATRRQRVVRRLALASPSAGRAAERGLRAALRGHEGLRLRGRWTRALYELLTLAYWQGVREATGGRAAFRQLGDRMLALPGDSPALEIDLASGLERVMRRLDEERPHAAKVRYREELVGTIPAVPGAEPLRGEHLRASLARELAVAFLGALGRAGVAPVTFADRVAASGTLPTTALEL